jgi:hypothetical protein
LNTWPVAQRLSARRRQSESGGAGAVTVVQWSIKFRIPGRGETIALKDIIRARNSHRRQLRATLADRQATVEALLGLRRGDEEAGPLFAETELPASSEAPPERSRLKRYFNDE